MSTLSKEFRRQLERVVLAAREEAERGAAAALESYGVGEARKPSHLDKAGEDLRKKLRAHGRQVGDVRRSDESQEVAHLVHECAYEHWHRMLFARFLAENGFLLEPESGLDVGLDFCEERARETKSDKWEVAASFAQRMLPGIFRPDDPVLQLRLPAESRNELTKVLASLSREVFLADDSLGWVYQFWQAKKKEEINDSEKKIGADELAAVTQLFTEDYMVEFLLHNTLGAWWTAKRQTEGKSQQLPFSYLRLKEDGAPAAGAFEGWPKTVKELRLLDPCMGSGHFLVFALVIIVRMRMEEEGLLAAEACVAVLQDNLFGLEIDPRCTQIAAFNLALAAWKLGGYQKELPLNLACSGLGLNAKKEDWLKLAERAAQTTAALAPESDLLGTREETLLSQKLKTGMERLYQLFQQAPVLGSLINPRVLGGDLLVAEFHDLHPLLAKALLQETTDDAARELVVTAQGVAKAAEILTGQFTLVATNVPYLGRGNQDDVLKDYCERIHADAKNDLATCFIERCLDFCTRGGSVSLVTPQNWFSQPRYENFRFRLLTQKLWNGVARLGAGAFETIGGEVVTVSLVLMSNISPTTQSIFAAVDVSGEQTAAAKALGIANKKFAMITQESQLKNPDAIITLDAEGGKKLLNELGRAWQGLVTGDDNRFYGIFWERPLLDGRIWSPVQQAPQKSLPYTGRETVVKWESARGDLHLRSKAHNFPPPSTFGKVGIAIQRMVSLNATIYSGEIFDDSVAPLIPEQPASLPAIYAFCLSNEFKEAVRRINHQPKVIPGALTKVPFDLVHWQKVAAEKYPNGLPKPFSSDPIQWLFNGHPRESDHPLHVAVARLLGYRWPRQTGSSFPDCPTLDFDGLEKHADNDGVVCFSQVRNEPPAATRLRALLADAYGGDWSHAIERKVIAATGSKADSLEDWLLDDFFAQHCAIFRNRPFVWHIWDGRQDGFNVLVNYHKLAGSDGEGHRTLETLTYAYLGDWIGRQKAAVTHGEAGADDRLAAALELQDELKKILAGEPPYDLFIRWKPLYQQPIGWEADINDGVRLNIRPFMVAKLSRGRAGCGLFRSKPGSSVKWDKDRGKEPSRSKEDFPWFWKWDEKTVDFRGASEFDGNRWNDCHYTTAFKRAAREEKAKA